MFSWLKTVQAVLSPLLPDHSTRAWTSLLRPPLVQPSAGFRLTHVLPACPVRPYSILTACFQTAPWCFTHLRGFPYSLQGAHEGDEPQQDEPLLSGGEGQGNLPHLLMPHHSIGYTHFQQSPIRLLKTLPSAIICWTSPGIGSAALKRFKLSSHI